MAEPPRLKRIKLDKSEFTVIVDSTTDSYLDKPVADWPEGVLIYVAPGIFARTLMYNGGEAKVTFAAYSDGSLTNAEICELYWNKRFHVDMDGPPTGTPLSPVRLDASVTLNLVEADEMRKILLTDNDRTKQENFFLSDDSKTPLTRGRVLIKNGRNYKLATVGMYETGSSGKERNYNDLKLGDNLPALKKLMKVLVERLAWLEDNKRFAGSEAARKTDDVRKYLKDKVSNKIVQGVLSTADGDPAKYGNKSMAEWLGFAKELYRHIDRLEVVNDMLNDETLSKGLSGLTIGEVRELVAKALLSPDHVNAMMESLFEKGGVLVQKRKQLVDKYNKRKLKTKQAAAAAAAAAVTPEPLDDDDAGTNFGDFEASQEI